MRATAATFRDSRFARTRRRLENSRTLPLLPFSLLPPRFFRVGSVAVVRFSAVCVRSTEFTGRKCGSSAGEETDDTEVRATKEASERTVIQRRRREENLDQPQALPSATSRRRFARETEREARAARDSPGSRESGEGVTGTSERTRER